MRGAGFDPRRAINGNYGEVMLDGELGQRGYGSCRQKHKSILRMFRCAAQAAKSEKRRMVRYGQHYHDENKQPYGVENCG